MGRSVDLAHWITERYAPRLRPEFIIAGVQKAGTSALFAMLAMHPDILAPEVKELHFFDREEEFRKGPGHYWRQFPKRPLRPGVVTFEATPSYIFHENAIPRIKGMLPAAKLVVILREPMSRAFSAWNMFRSFLGHPRYNELYDPRTFKEAVEDELAGRTVLNAHRYLLRGHYAEQLERAFNYLGREKVLVLEYDRFLADPKNAVDQVCDFVGLSPINDPEVLRLRRNVRPYNASIDTDVEHIMREYFCNHNIALTELVGISWTDGS